MQTPQAPIKYSFLPLANVEGILKALASCSLPARVIGTDISELQMGLYTVDRGYIAPHAAAPGFIDWLVSLCLKERVDVVLTGCEPVLRALAPVRSHLENATGALFLVCPPEVWTLCDDKYLTRKWLEEHGFPCPAMPQPTPPPLSTASSGSVVSRSLPSLVLEERPEYLSFGTATISPMPSASPAICWRNI